MKSIIQPNPKRYEYRIALLRERYLISINPLDPNDIIHDFICFHPVSPLNTVKGPSPAVPPNETIEPKVPADFKSNR